MSEKAVIYGRISRDGRKLNENGTFNANETNSSLDKQEDECLDYCKRKGFEVVATFSDADVSGGIRIAEREGGCNLLDFIQANASSGDLNLIIYSTDRLGRRASDVFVCFEYLEAAGVNLHVIDMGGDTLSTQGHNGWLVLAIKVVMSEWELKNTKKRYQDAAKRKMIRRERVCNLVYGFDAVSSGRYTVNNKGESKEVLAMVENPEEQRVIASMRDMQAQGMSYRQIVKVLNDAGTKTKDKGIWSTGMVYRILNTNKHNKYATNQIQPGSTNQSQGSSAGAS